MSVSSLVDAIRTGMHQDIGVFSNESSAIQSIISHTRKKRISLKLFKNGSVKNINPDRLSNNPYPKTDRPRGNNDMKSINYHRRTIRKNGQINDPIWIASKNNELVLLDGVHRIVATHLEQKRTIPAYVIKCKTRKGRKGSKRRT